MASGELVAEQKALIATPDQLIIALQIQKPVSVYLTSLAKQFKGDLSSLI